MKIVLGILSVTVLAFVLQDAFEVMLLPRRVRRRWRFMRAYYHATWAAWTAVAARFKQPADREHMLALYGPLSMLVLFAVWAALLITCFGTVEWALEPPGADSAVWDQQLYMSGVTFFTLGYGDVVPHSGAAQFTAVLEAGTGIGFIAVVIGYLPVLYQLFTRREAHVIQLDGRAGSPPSATAMLCRHAEGGGLDQLNELLREWEIWGSELLESHLSYPMLAYYRSQHDNQSWLAALACVMDASALVLVGVRDLPPLQARMTFTMARQVVVEMAHSFGLPPTRFDGSDRLPPSRFAEMEASFARSDVTWHGGAESQSTLAALRATYEPLLDSLARHLLLALPDWLPSKNTSDHWASGHRGLIAQRLMDELGDRETRGASNLLGDGSPGGRLWRRMRSRLRKP